MLQFAAPADGRFWQILLQKSAISRAWVSGQLFLAV
jgi:hypothetical protein